MTSSWLGFKDAEVGKEDEEPLTCEDSFIGGVPVLPDGIILKEEEVTCGSVNCGLRLSCLAQLFCPLDSHPNMHRSLLVLVCSNVKCHQTLKGWKVYRLQWEAKQESKQQLTSSTSSAKSTGFFQLDDSWGDDSVGTEWATEPSPSKKSHLDTEQLAEQVQKEKQPDFEQILEPYLIEFDAEDLSKIEDKNVDVEDEEDDDPGCEDDIRVKDLPDHCKNVARDAFTIFYHRILADPEQIVRYGGEGEYLPVYSNDVITTGRKCAKCSTPLICELQLLPSIHSCFKNSPLTHSSLGVFTCPNTTTSCADFERGCLKVSDLIVEVEKD